MKLMVFDGALADQWNVMLDADVEAQFVRLTPGVRYTLTIRQGSVGGHTFLWPNNCINMPGVDPHPHAISVQSGIALQHQTLVPHIPAAWAEP